MNEIVIERLAEAVYALVENSYDFSEGIDYDEACELMNLSEEETTAVIELIAEDMRVL